MLNKNILLPFDELQTPIFERGLGFERDLNTNLILPKKENLRSIRSISSNVTIDIANLDTGRLEAALYKHMFILGCTQLDRSFRCSIIRQRQMNMVESMLFNSLNFNSLKRNEELFQNIKD